MDIISIYFIALSLLSVFVFYLLKNKYRIIFLTLLSCAFIASFSLNLLIYVIAYSLVNYFIGLKMPGSAYKKHLFRTGLILNLTQLIILKYADFTLSPLFSLVNADPDFILKISKIIIPVGISFFTLQGIGYLINVKMGWEKPEKKLQDFILYITFYPKYLSGPIERSNHFLPQLKVNKTFNEEHVAKGLRIMLFGLFKKIVIANQLAPYVINAYSDLNSINGYAAWILLVIGPIYLYFDFSGYTDIARGLARTYGIDLLPNFNRPFFSENMTTFWRRFHMSLSSWFNDYIFKQTAFKFRKWGIYASITALLVTWTLFGVWHGAGWTFMVLGFIQAVAIIYEFFTKKWRLRLFSKAPVFIKVWIGRILTYFFYCISLVFFFSPDISSVSIIFSKLAEVKGPLILNKISSAPFMLLIYIPVIFLLELIENDFGDVYVKLKQIWWRDGKKYMLFRWTIYCLIIIQIIASANIGKSGQFIYANF